MRNAVRYITLFSLVLGGCATGSYQITSSPADATIDAVYANGTRRTLGKTPMTSPATVVNPGKTPFTIEISKSDFEKQSVYVPDGGGKEISINANLVPAVASADGRRNDERVEQIAGSVAEIQKDIQAKNYDLALSKISHMISENPNVSTFHSLAGNVHYLEKRTEKALASYKRALDLNPKNAGLTRIVEKLQGMKSAGVMQ